MAILGCLLLAGIGRNVIKSYQSISKSGLIASTPTKVIFIYSTSLPSRIQSAIATPTRYPTKTPTRTPPIKPTATITQLPTITPFFPVLAPVDINSKNYPEIYNPTNLIQNPENYRNKRFSITMYIAKIVNATINGEKQWIMSLSTGKSSSQYLPVLVFGLRSNYPYSSDPEVGNMITVYGIGMGGVDRNTLDDLFGGYWILPNELYTTDTNWSVSSILGEDYFIAQR